MNKIDVILFWAVIGAIIAFLGIMLAALMLVGSYLIAYTLGYM
jgi:hypothetical protein